MKNDGEAREYTPTLAYVRDAFISERLRDQGTPIPADGFYSVAVAREQEAWHRWFDKYDAERTELSKSLQPLYDAAMDDMAEGAVRWLGDYIERETGEWPNHESCDDTSKHGNLFDGWAGP